MMTKLDDVMAKVFGREGEPAKLKAHILVLHVPLSGNTDDAAKTIVEVHRLFGDFDRGMKNSGIAYTVEDHTESD